MNGSSTEYRVASIRSIEGLIAGSFSFGAQVAGVIGPPGALVWKTASCVYKEWEGIATGLGFIILISSFFGLPVVGFFAIGAACSGGIALTGGGGLYAMYRIPRDAYFKFSGVTESVVNF